MDQSVSQALGSLMPAMSGPPPPEIFELARSLIAQSHSKANNLGAGEEIARNYACTDIACHR